MRDCKWHAHSTKSDHIYNKVLLLALIVSPHNKEVKKKICNKNNQQLCSDISEPWHKDQNYPFDI